MLLVYLNGFEKMIQHSNNDINESKNESKKENMNENKDEYENENKKDNENLSRTEPTIFQIIGSVLSAMFGVQSSKVRQRDFKSQRPWKYVVVGLIMTIVFVLTILLIVKTSLSYLLVTEK